MSQIEITTANTTLSDYIASYRNVEHFMTFCKECNGFARTWACPPFETPIPINQYSYATIIGVKIWVEGSTATTRELLEPVREMIDSRILRAEALSAPARALFGGSCRGCPRGECTRPKGEACSKPHLMRPSLEAMGFDVGRTTSDLLGIELQWGKNGSLPEYYTLVFGLFTAEPIAHELIEEIRAI